MSIDRSTTKMIAGLAACGLLLAGCGEVDAGRAGSESRDEPRVLTFAQPNDGEPPEQLLRWAEDVERLSAGTLTIEFQNAWRLGEVEYEAGTLSDVGAGEVDLAWIGARAFDTVGVESFQALVAPMLVDSHALQAAVFEAGIPEQMLDGVEELDVVGVGVLPGPMRKLLSKDHSYVAADDFAGNVIGLQASGVAEQTFAALGATPTRLPSGADISDVDGYEQQLASIWGNHYELEADFITANLNLWPRPLVLVAGTDAFESLDADQQGVLREASANAIPGALEASREEDRSGGESLCGAGVTFTPASPDELAALRSALDPVYASLAEDPATAEFLDAIEALKDEVGAPPDAPECPSADANDATTGTVEASIPNGTYRTTVTRDEALQTCPDLVPDEFPGDESTYELTLEDGHVRLVHESGGEQDVTLTGTYTVFRDLFSLEADSETEQIGAQWAVDGNTLTFTNMEAPFCGYQVVWTTHSWVLVDAADPAASPSDEASLDGTYTATLTGADVEASGCEFLPWSGTDRIVFELTLRDGSIEQLESVNGGDRQPAWIGTYNVFRDQIELADGAESGLVAHWTFDGTNLVLSDMENGRCDDVVVWTTHPWVLVDAATSPPSTEASGG